MDAFGVEGGRAQELTNSQARRRDRARLAVAVVGGVVGRASAGTVHSARPFDGEGRRRRGRRWRRRRRRGWRRRRRRRRWRRRRGELADALGV
eukprot:scaffold24320_cov56-Phaeocystis_antarctica.AAC.2